ncbi:MAG: hypothetical protein GWN01_12720, partial [Nitrosopumilaceae archaeon]|nr:hypothetical protein [Nitrosopumilaceae archaeon]NIU88125.1 hypothetical protein [Nitrosopumilaceae archaeon]NIV66382.1 hypothetical protein [Nitrosopumilaceae archaeon]NIX62330.1 hypothetical protein [Nitrosopumilaceae archaeon]
MVDLYYAVISIVATGAAIASLKVIDYTKFRHLVGSYKASIVMIILILIAEAVYLSVNFKLLTYALETVTSLSALLIFF